MRGAIVALTLLAFLLGCGSSPSPAGSTPTPAPAPPRPPNAGGAAPPSGGIEANPAEAEQLVGAASAVPAVYVYDPTGKRDPFRSFRFEQELLGPEETTGPLESFELEQLSLVAVVWETPRPRALVAAPSGRSYIVEEGTRVGKNDGRVIHIGDNLVLVKETYEDFAGERTTKDVELRIRGSQGG